MYWQHRNRILSLNMQVMARMPQQQTEANLGAVHPRAPGRESASTHPRNRPHYNPRAWGAQRLALPIESHLCLLFLGPSATGASAWAGQVAFRGGSGGGCGAYGVEPRHDERSGGCAGSAFTRSFLFISRTYFESPTMMIFRRALVRCDMIYCVVVVVVVGRVSSEKARAW